MCTGTMHFLFIYFLYFIFSLSLYILHVALYYILHRLNIICYIRTVSYIHTFSIVFLSLCLSMYCLNTKESPHGKSNSISFRKTSLVLYFSVTYDLTSSYLCHTQVFRAEPPPLFGLHPSSAWRPISAATLGPQLIVGR